MKNPKVFGEVSHTLFLLPSSHQNHLSEQNRGSLRVVSLFGATNKSSRALHQMNSPLDWRLHKGLLTRCVRACFSGLLIEYIHTYQHCRRKMTKTQKEGGGWLSNFFYFSICQHIPRLLQVWLILFFQCMCRNPRRFDLHWMWYKTTHGHALQRQQCMCLCIMTQIERGGFNKGWKWTKTIRLNQLR